MNPEIKQLWIDALRSGEYEQGAAYLRAVGKDGLPDTFCCLGVLTDLAVKAGVIPEGGPDIVDGLPCRVYGEDAVMNMLPSEVMEWADIETQAGRLKSEVSGLETLWELNDNAKFSFDQIADVIEAQF